MNSQKKNDPEVLMSRWPQLNFSEDWTRGATRFKNFSAFGVLQILVKNQKLKTKTMYSDYSWILTADLYMLQKNRTNKLRNGYVINQKIS